MNDARYLRTFGSKIFCGHGVQAPTKFELVINLETAKTLGLDVPPTMELPLY